MKKNNIILLTGMFPDNEIDEIRKNSKGVIQNAANNLQWAYHDGFSRCDCNVYVINELFIGAFPYGYRKCRIKKTPLIKDGKTIGINTPFLNLPVIKHFSSLRAMKSAIRKKLSEDSTVDTIIGYSLSSEIVLLLKYAKKLNPKIKTSIIIPDLPDFMNVALNNNIIYKILKKAEKSIMYNALKYCDSYILLTEQMINMLPGKKPFCVIEGMASQTIIHNDVLSLHTPTNTVLYTGGLEKAYGIDKLIEAFSYIKSDVVLKICGDGTMKTEVEKAAEKNNKIVYCGQLACEKIIELQRNAGLLVNPRPEDGELTKYSFPSKTIEYLVSGTPVMAFRLSGIPEEYYKYIIPFASAEPQKMAKQIDEYFSGKYGASASIGQKAIKFILSEKTSECQCKKVMNFLKG